MSFKPIDESKEDYRLYLARHGVLDALTKVLSKIQGMQPDNPLEFLASNLSVSLNQQDMIRDLEMKLGSATQEINRLQKEVERLKQQQNRFNFK
ncbi:c-Myc-binding protein homolog [Chironomus tepperi]|uniref:c-Myc-binding protein homolog n=1 Tax=Chironomus tepperi TaxID=113505 RepID=UPI00391F952A